LSDGERPPGRLARPFFDRDPVAVARDLIGCSLLVAGVGGRIVETEAYAESEPACHAYVGVTDRTRVLFGPPGHAYVYLSYGVHQLFNIVTAPSGHGAAVLIRALEPTAGIERMRARRAGRGDRELCSGPGRLTQALGIGRELNGADLTAGEVALHPSSGGLVGEPMAGPRVGISKATDLPWRFCEPGSAWLSVPAG
jgi:DNA-3-methyladenine glycosylase